MVLAGPTGYQWSKDICLPLAILSGVLSIIHPPLYNAGHLAMECLTDWATDHDPGMLAVSQSVDLGQNNNPNTTPTKDYENVRVVVCLRGVQRGCAEEGERGSTPTG